MVSPATVQALFQRLLVLQENEMVALLHNTQGVPVASVMPTTITRASGNHAILGTNPATPILLTTVTTSAVAASSSSYTSTSTTVVSYGPAPTIGLLPRPSAPSAPKSAYGWVPQTLCVHPSCRDRNSLASIRRFS